MSIILILVLFIAACFVINARLSSRGYIGPVSDHFDGTIFKSYGHIPPVIGAPMNRSVFNWLLNRPKSDWKWLRDVVQVIPEVSINDAKVVVTMINHTTVLIQTHGLNIITDPIWAMRASPFSFLGPRRYRDAGVAFANLPPIDVVILSHNHYDHMDIDTLKQIHDKWHPRIITGLGNTEYLKQRGIEGSADMDWWDEIGLEKGIRIICVPAQHFSARSLSDRNKTLWCGFVLSTPEHDIYFAGDTGYGPFVQKIGERFSKFRLAFLPIGAYTPAWMMQPVHMSPDQALQVHKELNVRSSIAIHHGTFHLADDGQDEGANRLESLVGADHSRPDFKALKNGEVETIV